MNRVVISLFAIVGILVAASSSARAEYDGMQITEIYTNACGTIQFVELWVPGGPASTTGRELRIYDHEGTLTRTLTFTDIVFGENRFLLATPDFATYVGIVQDTQLGTLDPGDLDAEGGALWLGCCGEPTSEVDVIIYGDYSGENPPPGASTVHAVTPLPLPTNGDSLLRVGPETFESTTNTPANSVVLIGRVPSRGDINGDFKLDMLDVTVLVDVLIGRDTDPAHILRTDLNCNGNPDGLDMQPFLDELMAFEPPPCPAVDNMFVGMSYDGLQSFIPSPAFASAAGVWGMAALDIPGVYVIYVSDGQILGSSDGGCSWTQLATGMQGLFNITAGTNGCAYAWTYNGSSGDGSDPSRGLAKIVFDRSESRWTLTFWPDPTGAMLGFGVDPADGEHVRTGRGTGQLSESFNGGQSWTTIGVPASPSAGSRGRVVAFDPGDPNHVIYGRLQEGSYVTFNGGQTWTRSTGLSSTGTGNVNFWNAIISPVDGNYTYAMAIDAVESLPPSPPSHGKHMYASTDGGLNWRVILSYGSGGGEIGEGVLFANGPVMKASATDRNVFHWNISFSGCLWGGAGNWVYSYDLDAARWIVHVNNEYNGAGCSPKARQFEVARDDPMNILLGFEASASVK